MIGLASARVTIRERPLVDVVDLAIRFFFAHARPFALASMIVVAPACAAAVAIGARASFGLAWLFALGLAPVVALPFTILASRLVFEPRVRAAAIASATLRALPAYLVARVALLVASALGVMTFLLPGAWLHVEFLFLGEVVAVERAGPIGAFGRATRVVHGRFGTAMACALLLLGMHAVAIVLADVAGRAAMTELLQIAPPPGLFAVGGSALAFVGFFAFVPLLAVARFFVYLDLRTRLEGWDVQTRFAAIAMRARQDELEAQGPVSSRPREASA